MARTIGPKLAEKWGQQVIVDNRPGAGGAIRLRSAPETASRPIARSGRAGAPARRSRR
jgi:tripartite-type tricarboxylate transporter receptor subunit TctC